MKALLNIVKNKITYLDDDNISLDVKNFRLMQIYAVFGSFVMSLIFAITDLKIEVLYLSLFLLLFCILIGFISSRFNEYKLYTIVYLIVFNFLIYPIFFFLVSDIYNGVPLFLAMGIILTFFLTTGKLLYILVSFEIVWDLFLIGYSYYFREDLTIFRQLSSVGDGIAFCFLLASIFPLTFIYYLNIVYKKTHDRIDDSNNKLSVIGMVKNKFLANISHEIRIPMNSVFGMVEIILQENLSEEARFQAETIKNASSELLNIINNVLVYSTLESNNVELISSRCNFKTLLEEVIYTFVTEYSNDQTEFNVFIDHNVPQYIYGDEIRIKQVLRYLLFSSLHQLPHGKITFEMICIKNPEENTATFKCKLSESGKGLTESELKAVFGAYNEYDSRQSSDFKGMGLELFICRKILNLMDGSLRIESISGIGMAIFFEFTNYILDDTPLTELNDPGNINILIYLSGNTAENYWMPLMEDIKISPYYATSVMQFKSLLEEKKFTHIFVEDSDYGDLQNTIEGFGCENNIYVITDYKHVSNDFGNCKIIRRPVCCINIVDVLNGQWNKEDYIKPQKREIITYPEAKILVVDDNIVNIKVILSVLGKYGIKADMATSGEGCLNILNEKKYDLLLLDQLMPGLSGVETLHLLRKSNSINADIPVVCITADFGADVRERLLAEGFQDYLAKPVKKIFLERILNYFLPQELIVVSSETVESKPEKKIENTPISTAKSNEDVSVEISADPLEIDINRGIELVGGLEDVYNEILISYYQEGIKKLTEVPNQAMDSDLSLYSTNVHALKSSSASIGAINISERFKALEFAGKSNNREIVDNDTPEVMEQFKLLLDKVLNYLTEKGITVGGGEDLFDEPEGDIVILESHVIEDLRTNLANVNLKYCEDTINTLSKTNYGKDINKKINEIKTKYEQFDYRSVKTLLDELSGMI